MFSRAASGGSDLKANVWQTAPLSGEAQLTVVAQGVKGGTQAAITLVPEEPFAHEKLCPVLGMVTAPSASRWRSVPTSARSCAR